MVGNDVVDLLDADADASTYSPRFDERVFSDVERAWLDASGDEERGRWVLWAAKEAAYKALKQARSETIFSPSAFAVLLDPVAPRADAETLRFTGVVVRDGARLRVEVEADRQRVHAVARAEGEMAPDAEVAMIAHAAGEGGIDPSAFVRRRLVRKLAAALGVRTARLGFDRRARVPVVLLDGRAAPIEVSLAHHGRFVACAWSPRGVRRVRAHVRPVIRREREVCA